MEAFVILGWWEWLIVALLVMSGMAAASIAKRKGRSPQLWIALTVLGGCGLPLLILLLLPSHSDDDAALDEETT